MKNDRIHSFSSRLQEAMNMRGIKQADLCALTQIPKSAMSQYVNGAFEPKQDRLWKLARALQVSEAWLMGYDVPMEQNVNIELSNDEDKDISGALFRLQKELEPFGLTDEDADFLISVYKLHKQKNEA